MITDRMRTPRDKGSHGVSRQVEKLRRGAQQLGR